MQKITDRMLRGGGVVEDPKTLKTIGDNIAGRTICAFGEACAWPVQSFVGKFKDEFVAKGIADEERRVTEGKGFKPAPKDTLTMAAAS